MQVNRDVKFQKIWMKKLIQALDNLLREDFPLNECYTSEVENHVLHP